MGDQRHCAVCGERLSKYNAGPNCYAHTADNPVDPDNLFPAGNTVESDVEAVDVDVEALRVRLAGVGKIEAAVERVRQAETLCNDIRSATEAPMLLRNRAALTMIQHMRTSVRDTAAHVNLTRIHLHNKVVIPWRRDKGFALLDPATNNVSEIAYTNGVLVKELEGLETAVLDVRYRGLIEIFKARPDANNREVAAWTGMHHATVAQQRNKAIKEGEVRRTPLRRRNPTALALANMTDEALAAELARRQGSPAGT